MYNYTLTCMRIISPPPLTRLFNCVTGANYRFQKVGPGFESLAVVKKVFTMMSLTFLP